MSRVSKVDRLIVPNHGELASRLARVPGIQVLHTSPLLCLLEAVSPKPSVCEWRDAQSGWTRVFEQNYLAPSADDHARAVLVANFFDWISASYNDVIVHSRNAACYERLFQEAEVLLNGSTCKSVIDVGCGPGTVLSTSIPSRVELVAGYDISHSILSAAAAIGLRTMGRSEFLTSTKNFDLALSAYVMHYECDIAETLSGVKGKLRANGVWALNFHKGIGLHLFTGVLHSDGVQIAKGPIQSEFGDLVLIRFVDQ